MHVCKSYCNFSLLIYLESSAFYGNLIQVPVLLKIDKIFKFSYILVSKHNDVKLQLFLLSLLQRIPPRSFAKKKIKNQKSNPNMFHDSTKNRFLILDQNINFLSHPQEVGTPVEDKIR